MMFIELCISLWEIIHNKVIHFHPEADCFPITACPEGIISIIPQRLANDYKIDLKQQIALFNLCIVTFDVHETSLFL